LSATGAIRAATLTYRCADLDVKLARGAAVVHGVERRHLVDTHGRHLQYAGDLVHDADAGESMLALSKVEQRHDGGLLILRRIPRQDLLDELLVLGRELEGDLGIVLGRVAVLQATLALPLRLATAEAVRTTFSESLRAGRDTPKARH
tara:strand:- start:2170 stop:2613 length:444 start_codon:yes stop_codon:yes gene_type:complete